MTKHIGINASVTLDEQGKKEICDLIDLVSSMVSDISGIHFFLSFQNKDIEGHLFVSTDSGVFQVRSYKRTLEEVIDAIIKYLERLTRNWQLRINNLNARRATTHDSTKIQLNRVS